MRLPRRTFLVAGGLVLAGLGGGRRARAASPVEITMAASADGTRVFFDPVGLRIDVGQEVVWRCLVDVHTSTAYHPANDGKPRRIPAAAEPWDSGYLMAGEEFRRVFSVPGVYDYFCRPHEMAGMAGRIVVGAPQDEAYDAAAIPAAALAALPSVQDIVRRGRVSAE